MPGIFNRKETCKRSLRKRMHVGMRCQRVTSLQTPDTPASARVRLVAAVLPSAVRRDFTGLSVFSSSVGLGIVSAALGALFFAGGIVQMFRCGQGMKQRDGITALSAKKAPGQHAGSVLRYT
eukprot:2819947-Pleurochrysis_carterae.AAC.1